MSRNRAGGRKGGHTQGRLLPPEQEGGGEGLPFTSVSALLIVIVIVIVIVFRPCVRMRGGLPLARCLISASHT